MKFHQFAYMECLYTEEVNIESRNSGEQGIHTELSPVAIKQLELAASQISFYRGRASTVIEVVSGAGVWHALVTINSSQVLLVRCLFGVGAFLLVYSLLAIVSHSLRRVEQYEEMAYKLFMGQPIKRFPPEPEKSALQSATLMLRAFALGVIAIGAGSVLQALQ